MLWKQQHTSALNPVPGTNCHKYGVSLTSLILTFIKDETLAVEFTKGNNLTDDYEINECNVKISVEKI